MKIFQSIIFNYYLSKLKRYYKQYCKKDKLLKEKQKKKNFYCSVFIKDEEDKKLNASYIEEFEQNINKIKEKKNIVKNKICKVFLEKSYEDLYDIGICHKKSLKNMEILKNSYLICLKK